MNAHALRYSLLTAFVVIALAACGGAASPARSPESLAEPEPEPEPATIEEAQQQIARARSRLAGGASKAADPPAAVSEAAPSLEPATPSWEPGARPDSMTKQGIGNGPCSSPCRALVSMRRAVTALCRMTGDTDVRCVDAKRTLTDNEGRVTPCSC